MWVVQCSSLVLLKPTSGPGVACVILKRGYGPRMVPARWHHDRDGASISAGAQPLMHGTGSKQRHWTDVSLISPESVWPRWEDVGQAIVDQHQEASEGHTVRHLPSRPGVCIMQAGLDQHWAAWSINNIESTVSFRPGVCIMQAVLDQHQAASSDDDINSVISLKTWCLQNAGCVGPAPGSFRCSSCLQGPPRTPSKVPRGTADSGFDEAGGHPDLPQGVWGDPAGQLPGDLRGWRCTGAAAFKEWKGML